MAQELFYAFAIVVKYMKTRFLRSVTIHHRPRGDYGSLNIPKCIFDAWKRMSFTHTKIEYDEQTRQMIVTPI